MSYLLLGLLTGFSLIIAIGAQNIFVIEQGLKKKFVFIVCFICSLSDVILIFAGILVFDYFQSFFTPLIESILNTLLILFLFNFIWKKWNEKIDEVELTKTSEEVSFNSIILKTIGFTYLNPHVYSDTVFFLGNFSKNFKIDQKILFGIGASISSIIFFFIIGYLAKYFSQYINSKKGWKIFNKLIICFMTIIVFIVFKELFTSIWLLL